LTPFFRQGGLQVDIFFVISGFLLTYQILPMLSNGTFSINPFQVFLKRAFRLWPVMFVMAAVVLLLDEPFKFGILPTLFFVQNYDPRSIPTSMGPCWSNSVDIHVYVGLSLTLVFLHKAGLLNMKSLFILFLASIAMCIQIWDPEKLNIFLVVRDMHAATLLSREHAEYYSREYNFTWKCTEFREDFPRFAKFFSELYLPTHTRFGPFIVGSMVALLLYRSMTNNGQSMNAGNPPFSSSSPAAATTISRSIVFGKWIGLCISFLIIVIPSTVRRSNTLPAMWIQFVLTVSIRQIYALAIGFILFVCLVPKEHSYHCSTLAWILSWPIWYPFSVLSYALYLVHYRLQHHLALGFLRPPMNDDLTYDIDAVWILKLYLLSLIIGQLLALIIHVLIEVPFNRFRVFIFSKRKQNYQHKERVD